MVSLVYQEYEWNYNITVVNLGFWGIPFGVLKKPLVFKQRKLKFLLSHSFQDGGLFTWLFLQSPGIMRTMLRDEIYLDSPQR